MSSGTTPRSSAASIKGCCCCLFLLFSFLALLSLAIILVILLAIKPKKPQFDLQQVTIQSLGLATTNSFVIRMLFTSKNDNIAGIKYSDSTFTIMYRGVPVGRGVVRGFYQAAHSVKNVQTTVAVDPANLMPADAADLARDVTVNDRVEFRVMGDVNAKIRVAGVTSPGVQVSVVSFIDGVWLLQLCLTRILVKPPRGFF
ncbi:hypothetical protein R6Q57_020118 [Mikania cordata]